MDSDLRELLRRIAAGGDFDQGDMLRLERAAFRGIPEAREAILRLKLGSGVASPDNVIIRIAGTLGHPTVRAAVPRGPFMAAATENRALRRLMEHVVGKPDGMTEAQRVWALRGALWFAQPYWKPANDAAKRLAKRFLETPGVPSEADMAEAWADDSDYGALTLSNYLLFALANVTLTMPSGSRNVWASYAAGLAPFESLHHSQPLMTREQLLAHYQDFLDRLLFTWNQPLTADAQLADYVF